MRQGIISLAYRCSIISEFVEATPEAKQVAWMSSEDIPDNMTPAYSCRIFDARTKGTPSTRAHDGIDLLARWEA